MFWEPMANNLHATLTTVKGGLQNYSLGVEGLELKNLHCKTYITETNLAQTYGHNQIKC